MRRQAELIAAAVAAHGGARPLEQGEGDSVVAAFVNATDAVAAALEAQMAINDEPWKGTPLRVRMGVHTGEAEMRDEQTYGGAAIIRCARLRDLARGGQVLLSAAAAEVAGDLLPADTQVAEVGVVRLRGLERPERVHLLVHEVLETTFAPSHPASSLLGTWPTSLIGRGRERSDLAALLGTARVVTVTGAGGAGKSRLAHATSVPASGL